MRLEKSLGHDMEPKIFWPAGRREGSFFQTNGKAVLILMGDCCSEDDCETQRNCGNGKDVEG